ncbi:hypothetical protein Z051_15770 [Rhodococcus rhodochrous KG-21]|uniref:Acyl-CoA thioesterase 2 n=1 Tax=Rhodococcus rhodochrous KG-21 TaxID=1441923 RepID=A0A0M8PHV0_RHORH|nr:hypothetical protein Z051_15770 [Rhodococcus rhodochrous KG-21]
MTTSVDALLELLDVTAVQANNFLGNASDSSRPRVFGGQLLGQALASAGRTVEPGRSPHSLHAYFLRPGLGSDPIKYAVSNIREGRTFSTREVRARQGDRVIFEAMISFHVPEEGLAHQIPAPTALDPGGGSPVTSHLEQLPDIYREWGSLEIRRTHHEPTNVPGSSDNPSVHSQVWMRTTERLPDDPLLHACVLACISDLTLLSVALQPHGIPMRHEDHQLASIDHSMWFHRPIRADEWLLYDQSAISSVGSLALTQGRLFQSGETLVASVAQEGLIRPYR